MYSLSRHPVWVVDDSPQESPYAVSRTGSSEKKVYEILHSGRTVRFSPNSLSPRFLPSESLLLVFCALIHDVFLSSGWSFLCALCTAHSVCPKTERLLFLSRLDVVKHLWTVSCRNCPRATSCSGIR